MIKILIGSLFTALVIILIVLGLVNYNSRYSDTPDKDKYNTQNNLCNIFECIWYVFIFLC